MTRTVERTQNPTCNDTVRLRLFTYNLNNRKDIKSIDKVDIYFLDPAERTAGNPHGKRLVTSIEGADVVREATGQYLLELEMSNPSFGIGKYSDEWAVTFEDNECSSTTITNQFEVYPDLWFASPIPPIYDFDFSFRPNQIVKGTKRYLLIHIAPNVPRGSDIQTYYENLAIVADLRISIEIACGECVPEETDLRLVIDRELVDYREKTYAYYFLNTEELDKGTYNVWFELTYGENTFISVKNQFQII